MISTHEERKGSKLNLSKLIVVSQKIELSFLKKVAKWYVSLILTCEMTLVIQPILLGEDHLRDTFRTKVQVKHWNMHTKGFGPRYFENPRAQVFTVVIVQQMARMGSTIDTAHF